MVVVDKKDGLKCFCVDFRQLNKVNKPILHPLTVIDGICPDSGKPSTLPHWI